MKAITGESIAATWFAAARHLEACENWEDYNVILEVLNPMRRDACDRRIENCVDSFLRAANHFPLTTVAETIFPGGEYRRHGSKGVYEVYPEQIYPHVKPLPELLWGTYAHRLVRRDGPKGIINPLKCCVEKISKELEGKSTKTACYELSLSDFDIDIDLPIYDPLKDRNRRMSGPCLSHVSIKITRKRKLALTALYRSHYYVQKALGNLLGLARLQAFICEETKLEAGSLVCVSTYATLERTGGALTKRAISKKMGELAELTSERAPTELEMRTHVEQ